MLAQRRLGRCSMGDTLDKAQLLPAPARNMGQRLQAAYTLIWRLHLSEGWHMLKVTQLSVGHVCSCRWPRMLFIATTCFIKQLTWLLIGVGNHHVLTCHPSPMVLAVGEVPDGFAMSTTRAQVSTS